MKSGAQIPRIDPRYCANSFAERKLAEIIEQCFIHDADKRPDMLQIQRRLKDAILEDQEVERTKGNAEGRILPAIPEAAMQQMDDDVEDKSYFPEGYTGHQQSESRSSSSDT
jgi:hypothetical protein